MDLTTLPSHVLLLLAYSQLGEVQLRRVLADALAACSGAREATTRAQHVAAAIAEVATGKPASLGRLVGVLSIPTEQDAQLTAQLREALALSLDVGDHDRADALREALKDATHGRLFWQSSAKGMLTDRLAPSVTPLGTHSAPR